LGGCPAPLHCEARQRAWGAHSTTPLEVGGLDSISDGDNRRQSVKVGQGDNLVKAIGIVGCVEEGHTRLEPVVVGIVEIDASVASSNAVVESKAEEESSQL